MPIPQSTGTPSAAAGGAAGAPGKEAPPAPPQRPSSGQGRERFDPVGAVLACLFPGLGHYYLGEKGRALCIAAGVLSLFFGGMLIGAGPYFLSQRRQLVALAARHALPTIYNQREYPEVGGLIDANLRCAGST